MSLLYLIAAFLLIGSAEGWAAIAPAHMSMSNFPPASSAPSSPPRAFPRPRSSRSPSSSTRAATRWDRHLDLARIAHRRKHWGQVRLLCSRVISVADDWNAVEQAHLRLALAEQKDQRVDAARRVFQVRCDRIYIYGITVGGAVRVFLSFFLLCSEFVWVVRHNARYDFGKILCTLCEQQVARAACISSTSIARRAQCITNDAYSCINQISQHSSTRISSSLSSV